MNVLPKQCIDCMYFKPLPVREPKYNRWCVYHRASAMEHYDTCRDKVVEVPVKKRGAKCVV